MLPARTPSYGQSKAAQTLLAAYETYKGILEHSNFEDAKTKKQQLHAAMNENGLYGDYALDVLQQLKPALGWEVLMYPEFAVFYKFVFFAACDRGRRMLMVDRAVQAWQLVLKGRFRLLDNWCDFLQHSTVNYITEDTWRQVLDFSRCVLEDLSNYDVSSSWSTLLDEFVDSMRAQHSSSYKRSDSALANELNLLQARSDSDDMADRCDTSATFHAVSPRSGSKRRYRDPDSVAMNAGSERSMLCSSNIDDDQAAGLCSATKRLRLANGDRARNNSSGLDALQAAVHEIEAQQTAAQRRQSSSMHASPVVEQHAADGTPPHSPRTQSSAGASTPPHRIVTSTQPPRLSNRSAAHVPFSAPCKPSCSGRFDCASPIMQGAFGRVAASAIMPQSARCMAAARRKPWSPDDEECADHTTDRAAAAAAETEMRRSITKRQQLLLRQLSAAASEPPAITNNQPFHNPAQRSTSLFANLDLHPSLGLDRSDSGGISGLQRTSSSRTVQPSSLFSQFDAARPMDSSHGTGKPTRFGQQQNGMSELASFRMQSRSRASRRLACTDDLLDQNNDDWLSQPHRHDRGPMTNVLCALPPNHQQSNDNIDDVMML